METVFQMTSTLSHLIQALVLIQTYCTPGLSGLSHALRIKISGLDALHELIVLVLGNSLLPLHQPHVQLLTADFPGSAQQGRIDHHAKEHYN